MVPSPILPAKNCGAATMIGKDHRRLAVERGEPGEALVVPHVGPPGGEDAREGAAQAPRLHRLAVVERNRLGVLADAHHAVAEIGVVALQREVDAHQRPTDHVCGPGARERVQDRRPHHVAGHVEAAEQWQHEAARQVPQHRREGDERHHLQEQAQRDAQGLRGEGVAVLLDALLGVADAAARQLHVVVGAVGEPVAEVDLAQPAPPADGEQLHQPGAIDHRDDEQGDEHHPVTSSDQNTSALRSCRALKKRAFHELMSLEM